MCFPQILLLHSTSHFEKNPFDHCSHKHMKPKFYNDEFYLPTYASKVGFHLLQPSGARGNHPRNNLDFLKLICTQCLSVTLISTFKHTNLVLVLGTSISILHISIIILVLN